MPWALALLKVRAFSRFLSREPEGPVQRFTGLRGTRRRYGWCPCLFSSTLHRLFGIQADCVFPTRTARFGVALTFHGPLNLRAIDTHFVLATLADLDVRF